MTTIIVLLFVLHLAAVWLAFRNGKHTYFHYQELEYIVKRGYHEGDYALPSVSGITEEQMAESSKQHYNNHVLEARDIFTSSVAFVVYYTCVALLSLVTALYLIGIIK